MAEGFHTQLISMAHGLELPAFAGSPLVALILTAIAIATVWALYNIFLHPLSAYPGPWLFAASEIPYILLMLSGRPHERVLKLHEKYGDIVRIAPNDLSFTNPEAWAEVMNVRAGGVENNKDPSYVDPQTGSIVSVPRADHVRIRRILSDGFSPRALSRYPAILEKHASSLIQVLRARCEDGTAPVDMVRWSHFVLIDMVYELTLGEPFGCLETQTIPPCVDMAFSRAKLGAYVQSLLRIPGTKFLLWLMVPKSVIKSAEEYQGHLKGQVQKRLESNDGVVREDFVESMVAGKRKHVMSLQELHTNTEVLIIGGSETTASGLCAALFCLAAHPDTMQKVENEIFSNIQILDGADMAKFSQLKMLRAVIHEALRLHPPAPVALPRKAPKEGIEIFGKRVPGETTLGIWQWAAYHSKRNFKRPFDFMPERWLTPESIGDPRPQVFNPFSFGPRNCIGQNLAMFELQLVLVHLIWNFKITIAEESRDWLEQDVYILWQKKPLMVYLRPREQ